MQHIQDVQGSRTDREQVHHASTAREVAGAVHHEPGGVQLSQGQPADHDAAVAAAGPQHGQHHRHGAAQLRPQAAAGTRGFHAAIPTPYGGRGRGNIRHITYHINIKHTCD